ncbi:DUF4340 domain-containing protein [Paenibacillus wenxiniae]|uniref:DUF4340 domain-containing protein n=1 Tax=Paenibacillus wenxiniae TaxID=1636843 RepID=A0ABW4RJJ6_9BACL
MVKKLLPSIILLLVLAGGVGYAYSQHFFQKKDEAAPVEAKLLTLNTDELQQIAIRPSTTDTDREAAVASTGEESADTNNSTGSASTGNNKSSISASNSKGSAHTDSKASEQDGKSGTADASADETDPVTLVRQNNEWQITEPAAYPANTYMIADWLDTLQSATIHSTIDASPTDVSKYGIQANQPSIVLTTTNGQKFSISLGSETPERDYNYARVNDGPIVQIAAQTINDLSDATAFHFIDTTPFGWDDQQLSKLVWKGSTPTAEWTLTHQLSSGGDPNQDKWSLNDHTITPSQAGSITDAIKNIPTDEVPVAADQVKGYKQVLTLEMQLMDKSGHDKGSGSTSSQLQYTGWQAPDDKTYIWIVEPTGKWAYRLPADSIRTAAKTATEVWSGKD